MLVQRPMPWAWSSWSVRAALDEGARPVERYRRLTTAEALALLASPAPAPAALW